MIDKCTIDGDEFQPFNVTLREQQPVERVAGGRLGIDSVEDVSDFYIEDLQAN